MALISINSNPSYGFNASLEIDRTFFSCNKTFTTETKTVDGMPDVKWYIKAYPIDPNDKQYFGIYAHIESEKEIDYKINGYKGSTAGTKEITIKQEKLDNFFNPRYSSSFTNGKYKFAIEGAFSYKKNASYSLPKICNPVEWGLRLKENLSEDFNIIIGDETLKVHKLILAAESPVFKRMFENDFKEAKENKVTITDSSVPVVKAFIDYCYGRNMECNVDKIKLLYLADKYDCQTLKPQLETFLATNLTPQNVALYISTADKANALQLRQACIEFVRKVIHSDDSFAAEEMDSFDVKFMKDVFAYKRVV